MSADLTPLVADAVLETETPTRSPVATDERITPAWLFDALHAEFDFLIDAAATDWNRKVIGYFGLDQPSTSRLCRPTRSGGRCYGDGLTGSWADACQDMARRPLCRWRPASFLSVFLNCPYSRGSIVKWCAKAEAEAAAGVTTVLLLPADTSTAYFHRYVLRHEHRFVNSRVAFEGAPLDKHGRLPPAKFGSVIVVMRPSHTLWTWG